jgi:hypothetical protein
MSLPTYGEERERERDRKKGYFTSNCAQKNISQPELLTFLMLLASYFINCLRCGAQGALIFDSA